MTWQEIRDRKKAIQKQLLSDYLAPESAIPTREEVHDVTTFIDSSDLLSETEKAITSYNAPQLVEKYQAGLSVVEAIDAYCHRATLAHQLTNCITEVRFKEALEEAQELDDRFKATGKLVGPLHGLAVSLKDNINIKGFDTTLGLIGLAEKPAQFNSAIVTLLKQLGAVIICKTNLPSAVSFAQTENLLWGWTWNPFSRKYLNVGGSSGGEGAMGALRGSSFGIGSDLGGSVRHPAALNNIYSIKPSVGRFPKYGTSSGEPGEESIMTVYGILSNHLETVQYVMKASIDAEPYKLIDATCLPIPYRTYELPAKLKIGIMSADGLNHATAPLIRGLNIVKSALEQQGHEVIDWSPKLFPELRDILYNFYGASGSKFIKSVLASSGEPTDPHLSIDTARDIPTSEIYEYHTARSTLVQQYLELWRNAGIDAVIVPTSAYPGCLLDRMPPQPFTSVWNVLDYSATTFPVTRCDVSIDKPIRIDHYLSETDKEVQETYASELNKFDGGPVSFQLVCNRLEEEKCLELTKYVSSLLN